MVNYDGIKMVINIHKNEKQIKPLLLFIVMLLLFAPSAFTQNKQDGTEGEVFDSSKIARKNWTMYNFKFTTLKIGAAIILDYATYKQDATSKQQISMQPGFSIRDMRVLLSGQLKFKRNITWKVGLMYDGPSKSWFARESGILIGVPELSGNIFLGRTKEGFSMSKIMVGYAGWCMERQMGIDLIPILADGIKYMGYYPTTRILFNIGVFNDWLSKSESFSTYHWQTVARIGFLPIFNESKQQVFHVAFNGRYGKTEDNVIRVKSKPEVGHAPVFVDSKAFTTDYSIHYGPEIYYKNGSWLFGGEYYFNKFSSISSSNPFFHGGELMTSWILTGESRPYHTGIGSFGFVPVKRPVFSGGPGALEIVARITNIDLNSGSIEGGKFWRFTPMVNWYLSSNIRFELEYGYGVLSRFNQQGGTNFFQCRLQVFY